MYAQTAIKQNPIRRNGATDIVMRGVHPLPRLGDYAHYGRRAGGVDHLHSR